MHGHKIIKVVAGVVLVAILVVGGFVVHTFHGGNLQKARQIAIRLQTAAMANPGPAAGTASSTPTPAAGTVAGPSAGASAAAASPAAVATGARAAAAAKATTAVAGTAVANSSAPPSTSAAAAAAAAAAKPAVKSGASASGVAPRRQPTSAEVAQAITAVHDLLPFVTPTADQIASAGNQVCTALDQGTSFAQVKSQALDMVGAGSISWMIPSSVPEIAIRTVVALYCPINAAKLH
jgi:hypothetical protein